jgi:hypothetical protein
MIGGDTYSGVVESMTEEALVLAGDVDGQEGGREIPWSAIQRLDKDSIPKAGLLIAIGIAGGAVIILGIAATIVANVFKATIPTDS